MTADSPHHSGAHQSTVPDDQAVKVRGARQNNLRNIDVTVPRNALVVFTGVSGSGKSSLAFGTLFAESQRRYLESVAPYARRLIDQAGVPEVDSITGMPPAVALQQQRGSGGARSTVGSLTTISSVVRMLFSRAGEYPEGQEMLFSDDYSANTVQGACPQCHGVGQVYEVTEESMVPDPSLSIRERAIASWPGAWHGHSLRDILITLGYDVDTPWKDLPAKDREWILFTEDRPTVGVYAHHTREEAQRAKAAGVEPNYQGRYIGARRHVLDTFANTKSAAQKKRVAQFMETSVCPTCQGKLLKPEALSVTFRGVDIAEFSGLPVREVIELLGGASGSAAEDRLREEIINRLQPIAELGLGYLSLGRSTPTLSGGELQRLRLATQLTSDLFGVVYVLDEPSAGLHPKDIHALLEILNELKAQGNSLFIVEHSVDVISNADWLVDIGPGAGERGGQLLYSGPPAGLKEVEESATRSYLFGEAGVPAQPGRTPRGWLQLEHASRNNLQDVSISIPLGALTAVTGVSGSGKSSLVSQVLPAVINDTLGAAPADQSDAEVPLLAEPEEDVQGQLSGDIHDVKRVVTIDQKPIGRTPRSNVATYTGMFDHVRRRFAATDEARKRGYKPGRFSFNVSGGRCPECDGEGFVMVELLFLPSVYTECPVCHGTRFKQSTLEVTWQGKNIAEILQMTVEQALEFFAEDVDILRSISALSQVGLGYLRLGQPATELSGGEAQRVKLATELQRAQRGDTLYILDEPTTGLHGADADRLIQHLQSLVDAGSTVVIVELNMRMVAVADYVIDMGPGAGDQGGQVIASGTPQEVAETTESPSAPYLAQVLELLR